MDGFKNKARAILPKKFFIQERNLEKIKTNSKSCTQPPTTIFNLLNLNKEYHLILN